MNLQEDGEDLFLETYNIFMHTSKGTNTSPDKKYWAYIIVAKRRIKASNRLYFIRMMSGHKKIGFFDDLVTVVNEVV